MSRSNLCDCSDAYIVFKRAICDTRANNTNEYDKKLAFENKATFISCI